MLGKPTFVGMKILNKLPENRREKDIQGKLFECIQQIVVRLISPHSEVSMGSFTF